MILTVSWRQSEMHLLRLSWVRPYLLNPIQLNLLLSPFFFPYAAFEKQVAGLERTIRDLEAEVKRSDEDRAAAKRDADCCRKLMEEQTTAYNSSTADYAALKGVNMSNEKSIEHLHEVFSLRICVLRNVKRLLIVHLTAIGKTRRAYKGCTPCNGKLREQFAREKRRAYSCTERVV